MKTICIDRFGRGHWFLLYYIVSVCKSSQGDIAKLERSKLRCNPETHPHLAVGKSWSNEYSTRLKGYSNASLLAAERDDLIIDGHDDWDCLNDLELAGLITIISTANNTVQITKKGLLIAAQIESHRDNGGAFASFDIKETLTN